MTKIKEVDLMGWLLCRFSKYFI